MSIAVDDIPLHAQGGYNVVVETPRGSRTKFAYDPETRLFCARKLLAPGLAFPFAFGFFPSTRGEDGGPLDVMLLTGADLPMGTLVRCRLLGGVAIEQSDEKGTLRNDRLLAVPLLRHQDRPPHRMSDLPREELQDLENFLVAYQAADGTAAKVIGRLDKSQAEAVIAAARRE